MNAELDGVGGRLMTTCAICQRAIAGSDQFGPLQQPVCQACWWQHEWVYSGGHPCEPGQWVRRDSAAESFRCFGLRADHGLLEES